MRCWTLAYGTERSRNVGDPLPTNAAFTLQRASNTLRRKKWLKHEEERKKRAENRKKRRENKYVEEDKKKRHFPTAHCRLQNESSGPLSIHYPCHTEYHKTHTKEFLPFDPANLRRPLSARFYKYYAPSRTPPPFPEIPDFITPCLCGQLAEATSASLLTLIWLPKRKNTLQSLHRAGCPLRRFGETCCLHLHGHHHHHHHVPEGLGVFPVPWSSKWSWSLHLFFGRPMFLRPFGLYRNAIDVVLTVHRR